MAEYDGSIRIGTGIDTQGFDKDGKKLEAKTKKLAENISGSSDVEIKINASDAKKEIEEVFDDIKKEEKRIEEIAKRAVERARRQQNEISAPETPREGAPLSTPGYNQDAIKFIEEDVAKTEESAKKAKTTLLSLISEAKMGLKELSAQGFGPGDEEYDYAAQKLTEYNRELQVYTKGITDSVQKEIFGLNSIEGKIADVNQRISELSQMGFGIESPEMQEQLMLRAELLETEKNIYKEVTKTDTQRRAEVEKQEAAQRRAEEQEERALQKENARIQKEAEIQEKLQKQAAEEQRLADIKANATVSDQRIIDLLKRRKQLIAEIKDMESAGVGLGYKQYEDANRELEQINEKIKDYKKNLGSVPEKFDKMRKSANKAFNAVSSGTKKSSGLLSTFASRLKGLALSLLIFNWISKGFNAMISGIKKGFENFAGYSSSYAKNVQNMKNAMSTLGNQFAAAFAPIAQVVIPWLTQLINIISRAMTYVAQFIAVLGGNSTFTKAKKVQDDYNKSLGGTAKAAEKARGALAKFDDLDVLEKKSDASGGGLGEIPGKDMFEEAPIDSKFIDVANKMKETLSQIFHPLKAAWDDQGQYVMDSWVYALEEIGLLSQSIGKDFLNVWNQPETVSVFENILGIFGDIGTTVGNLSGQFREAWETNNVGLSMLENIRDIFGIIIGHIREASLSTVEWSSSLDFTPLLESINGLLVSLQPLTDNIGGGLEWFYTNVLLPIAGWTIEDAIPAFLDMLSAAIDALNIVLEKLEPLGKWLWDKFLKPLGEWTGDSIVHAMETMSKAFKNLGDSLEEDEETFLFFKTILEDIQDLLSKFGELYEEHLKPFFDSLQEGLLDTAEKFMEFWNDDVSPLLDEWGKMFDEVWKEHLKPVLDKFMELLGKVFDYLKLRWEKTLKPFIDWIIANILPVIIPIIDGVGKSVLTLFGMIGDIVGGIIDIFSGLLDFLIGAFSGDWEKMWNGAVEIFKGIFNLIPSIAEGVVNQAIDVVNGIIRGINNLTENVGIPSIPEIGKISIPRLATGAVIRGGNPFMAVLGDQPAGQTNIEAPLDTIKQAVREEMSGMNIGSAAVGQARIVLNINGIDVGEAILDDLFSVMNRRGLDVEVLGVT